MVAIKRRTRRANRQATGKCVAIALVVVIVAFVFFGDGSDDYSSQESLTTLSDSILSQRQADKRSDNEKVVDAIDGTHTTNNGYFADYLYERENPAFRQQSVPNWKESEEKAAALMKDIKGSIRSCQYLSDDHRILRHAVCSKETTMIVAYNSAPFERSWCGVKIPPHSSIMAPMLCKEAVKLFPSNYDSITGKGMPSIVIRGSKGSSDAVTDFDCDIPCKVDQGVSGLEVFIEGTDWKIVRTSDDPSKTKEANVERHAYRSDIYYSTTSSDSSVPLSLFSFEKFNIFTPPVQWDEVKPSGSYLIDSKCDTQASRRHRWQEALSSRTDVVRYGKCNHDTDLPDGMSLEVKADRLKLLQSHRFNLAFEAGQAKDYVTNIVYEAFESGTLPIVLGAANVKDIFPPNSFISAGDFMTWDKLSIFVKDVVENKSKWESYQKWRTDQLAKDAFSQRHNFTRTPPTCRLCRWAYAKKYGLGWNHEEQSVRKNALPRNMCVDEKKSLVIQPFRESWHANIDEIVEDILIPSLKGLCNEVELSPIVIKQESLSIERQLFEHDGVVDMIITSNGVNSNGDILLRLTFPIKNKGGAYFPDAHTLVPTVRGALVSSIAIQDSKVKVMVLASWDTKIWSPCEGVVEVTIQSQGKQGMHADEHRKIRVIVEDISSLHDKATEFYPSSYGKLMTQDFVDPLETLYLE